MSGGPIVLGSAATCGFGLVDPDYANSACILLWAHNPEASWPGLYMHDLNEGPEDRRQAHRRGPQGNQARQEGRPLAAA
ncbi:MAG: hypothetical protein MZU91_01700 [Desulfosudis oleivorans]|nr:hypothetical protein [Desulfosudis oleivorans]